VQESPFLIFVASRSTNITVPGKCHLESEPTMCTDITCTSVLPSVATSETESLPPSKTTGSVLHSTALTLLFSRLMKLGPGSLSGMYRTLSNFSRLTLTHEGMTMRSRTTPGKPAALTLTILTRAACSRRRARASRTASSLRSGRTMNGSLSARSTPRTSSASGVTSRSASCL
jgi:hypothetical protein